MKRDISNACYANPETQWHRSLLQNGYRHAGSANGQQLFQIWNFQWKTSKPTACMSERGDCLFHFGVLCSYFFLKCQRLYLQQTLSSLGSNALTVLQNCIKIKEGQLWKPQYKTVNKRNALEMVQKWKDRFLNKIQNVGFSSCYLSFPHKVQYSEWYVDWGEKKS